MNETNTEFNSPSLDCLIVYTLRKHGIEITLDAAHEIVMEAFHKAKVQTKKDL